MSGGDSSHPDLRPILPAHRPDGIESSEPSPSASRAQKKRAPLTSVACQECRKRKTKCDGQKPTCSNCAKRGKQGCVYDLEPNQSRVAGYKQKIDQQRSTIEALEIEIHRLRDASRAPSFDAGQFQPPSSPYRTIAGNGGGLPIEFLMNPAPESGQTSSASLDSRESDTVRLDHARSVERQRAEREAELTNHQRNLERENRSLRELVLLLNSVEDREVAQRMAEEVGVSGVSDDILIRAQHLLASQAYSPSPPQPLKNAGARRQEPALNLPDRSYPPPFNGQIDPTL